MLGTKISLLEMRREIRCQRENPSADLFRSQQVERHARKKAKSRVDSEERERGERVGPKLLPRRVEDVDPVAGDGGLEESQL